MSIHQTGPSLLQSMAATIDLHRQYSRIGKAADAIPDAVPRSMMTKERVTLPMRNNVGGRAPELVIMKRISTSEQEEQAMPSNFSTLLRSAISNLEAGNLDQAEHLLTKAEKLVDQSTTVHHHHYGSKNKNNDDGEDNSDYEDDWSEPATKPNAKGYSKAASNNRNGNGNSLDDEPDDDEDDDDQQIEGRPCLSHPRRLQDFAATEGRPDARRPQGRHLFTGQQPRDQNTEPT
jgi:hypothetical protein